MQFGRGLTGKRFQDETNHNRVTRYPQEPWNMPHHLSQTSQHLNSRGRGQNFQMPLMARGENKPSFIDKLPDVNTQLHGPFTVASRMNTSTIDSLTGEARSVVAQASVGLRPSAHMHNSNPLPVRNQKVQHDFINSSDTLNNQGPNKSLYNPGQQFDGFDNKDLSSTKLPRLPYQKFPLAPANQQTQMQTPLQPQLLTAQEGRENFLSSGGAPVPPHLVTPNINRGYISQGHGVVISTGLSNPVPLVPLNLRSNNIANGSLQIQGGGLPPLPPGPPPTSLQAILPSHNAGPVVSSQHPGSAFSGLIGSLMAQGLISLTKPTPAQVSEHFPHFTT